MNKIKIKAIIIGLVICITLTGGYYAYSKLPNNTKAATTNNNNKEFTATKMNMKIGIQGTGSVYAGVSKDIVSNNSGTLQDLNLKVGDKVEAGAKLFACNNDDLTNSLNTAQQNLNQKNLNLQNDTNSYNDSISKANAAINDAQTQLDNAKNPVNTTTTSLVTNKTASSVKTSSLTNNKNGDSTTLSQNIEKLQANLDKQKSALTDLKNSTKLQIDNLDISDAQSQLNIAKDAVNKMTVNSPISGVIALVNKNNGDSIGTSSGTSQSTNLTTNSNTTSGVSSNAKSSNSSTQSNSSKSNSSQTSSSSKSSGTSNSSNSSSSSSTQSTDSVLTIVDSNSMKVKVAVDELDIAKIKEGQKAEIRFDAITDKIYEGTVESIPQTGTTTNGVTTYDVSVSLSDSTDIKIGMSANINILIDSKDNALTVPADAVISKDGKKYVIDENNTFIEVTTGLENENYIEILTGVTEGKKLKENK